MLQQPLCHRAVSLPTIRIWLGHNSAKQSCLTTKSIFIYRGNRIHVRPVLVKNTIAAIDSGILKGVLAQTEISYANSLIESWWRIFKNQWLYLNTLDSFNAVESLVEFYVAEHNTHLPHSAFRGQTPDKIYYDTNKDIPEQLKENRATARSARLAWNQQATCESCCTKRPTASPT